MDGWSRDDHANCNWNGMGLNAIFMAVSLEEFKRTLRQEIVNEAWDILEVTLRNQNGKKF